MARFYALGAPVLTASWAITYKGGHYIRAKKNRPVGRPAVTSCREIKLSLKACPRLLRVLHDPLATVSSAHKR
jgi:hypothetical protein